MKHYTVQQDNIPEALRSRFFYAWIKDAQHPDDPERGASISWHQSLADAMDVCDMLNEADAARRAKPADPAP